MAFFLGDNHIQIFHLGRYLHPKTGRGLINVCLGRICRQQTEYLVTSVHGSVTQSPVD